VTSADFNGDGKADLAAQNANFITVSVLLGNGDGTFSTGQDFAVDSMPSAVVGTDLDGDAKADLAVSNVASDNVSVLFNNGSGGFQAAQNFPAGDGPAFVVGADFNADSFTDLAVANQNSNNLSVLLNTAVPPQTTITNGPSEGQEVNSTSAMFAFTSSEPGSTFQCALDNPSAYSPCTSPKTVPDVGQNLAEGSHTYKAKATDKAGNASAESNPRTVTVDTTVPTVVGATPPNLATGVGRGISPTATFSEKMKASTIKATTFKLFKVNPDKSTTQITDVVVSLSSDGLTAKLNPFGTTTTVLAPNTKYKAVVTTGAKDLAGNSLAQQKSWTFTTKP